MTKEKPQHESPLDQQQPYDNALKSLLEGQEAQILPHLLPEAVYQEAYNVEVVRTILRADRIYKILYKGHPHILHLEFETSSNPEMAVRLLDYHAYLHYKYGLPVISMIVYPFRTTIATSPLEEMSDGEVILRFHFRTFPLWLLNAKEYIQDHVITMYALLPAMSGANARLLDQAIDEMVEYYQNDEITLARDLRWMGIILRRTDCVLKEEKPMIQERLSMYDDLMENDPEMQRLRAKYAAEGRAEGIAKGKAEGLAKGKAEGKAEGVLEGEARALRETILLLVKQHFPTLKKQARQCANALTDVEELRDLFEQLVSASDETVARTVLTESQV